MCISCSKSFHKKFLKLTPKTFNKFYVSKNFLCVDCTFKNLPFNQSSDSSDYYSTGPKSSFPSNDQLKIFNNCNFLEIISNNEEVIFKINSKYFTIKEFLNLDLNDNSLKVKSCKLHNNKYMIASTQITNFEIFVFIAVLVFKLLSCKALFINRKDYGNG